MVLDTMVDSMRLKEEDAFRLQYFSRDRSFLERSVNHPLFGIYPASYMWGKIMPELVKFVAKEPFGLQTGAMAKAFYDVRLSMATQRELDTTFDKLIEDLGHSPAVWMLGYAMPALPWDISAAAPVWSRQLAKQARTNQDRAARGLDPLPIDLGAAIAKQAELISPIRQLNLMRPAVGELGDILNPSPETPKGLVPVVTGAANIGHTAGTALGPLLADDMARLRALLANQ